MRNNPFVRKSCVQLFVLSILKDIKSLRYRHYSMGSNDASLTLKTKKKLLLGDFPQFLYEDKMESRSAFLVLNKLPFKLDQLRSTRDIYVHFKVPSRFSIL